MQQSLASSNCPCGSNIPYAQCCGPFHDGSSLPSTAEQLMRSRYCAFVKGDGRYLRATLAHEHQSGFDPDSVHNSNTLWTGLRIQKVFLGGILDQTGEVEFIASYRENGIDGELHERSRFERRNGRWYYVDGEFPNEPSLTQQNAEPSVTRHRVATISPLKIGRNDPCPCGSGKKYKKCCG
ncbi:YchJ family protein [Thalassospira sp. MA62]|nr:YchJ family protein [Thalassospira sp. MA62]